MSFISDILHATLTTLNTADISKNRRKIETDEILIDQISKFNLLQNKNDSTKILSWAEFKTDYLANNSEPRSTGGGVQRGMLMGILTATVGFLALQILHVNLGFLPLAIGGLGAMLGGAAIGSQFPTNDDKRHDAIDAYRNYIDNINKSHPIVINEAIVAPQIPSQSMNNILKR